MKYLAVRGNHALVEGDESYAVIDLSTAASIRISGFDKDFSAGTGWVPGTDAPVAVGQAPRTQADIDSHHGAGPLLIDAVRRCVVDISKVTGEGRNADHISEFSTAVDDTGRVVLTQIAGGDGWYVIPLNRPAAARRLNQDPKKKFIDRVADVTGRTILFRNDDGQMAALDYSGKQLGTIRLPDDINYRDRRRGALLDDRTAAWMFGTGKMFRVSARESGAAVHADAEVQDSYALPLTPLPAAKRIVADDSARDADGDEDKVGDIVLLGEDGKQIRRYPNRKLAASNDGLVRSRSWQCFVIYRGAVGELDEGELVDARTGKVVARADVLADPDLRTNSISADGCVVPGSDALLTKTGRKPLNGRVQRIDRMGTAVLVVREGKLYLERVEGERKPVRLELSAPKRGFPAQVGFASVD